jgi:hypothetical protein
MEIAKKKLQIDRQRETREAIIETCETGTGQHGPTQC